MEPRISLATASQSESSLLNVLPLEIRTQIWTLSIGGQDIYLDVSESTKKLILTQPLPSPNLIALLLVCRQTYTESHSLIFTTSTFHIPSPSTLHALATSLPPTTLPLLRIINITYTLPTLPTASDFYIVTLVSRGYTPLCDIVDWTSMWETLRSLGGLRNLKVVLKVVGGQKEGWRRREEEILVSVCESRTRNEETRENGGEFVLVFPWEKFVEEPGVVRLDGEGEETRGEGHKNDEDEEGELYKGWRIERAIHDGRNVFSLFGVWNMQRELERVWESQNIMAI